MLQIRLTRGNPKQRKKSLLKEEEDFLDGGVSSARDSVVDSLVLFM